MQPDVFVVESHDKLNDNVSSTVLDTGTPTVGLGYKFGLMRQASYLRWWPACSDAWIDGSWNPCSYLGGERDP